MKNHTTYADENPASNAFALQAYGMTEATLRREVRAVGGWARYALSTLYATTSDLVRAESCAETARQRINRAKFAMVTAEEQGSTDADPFLSPLSDAQEMIALGYTARAELKLIDVAVAYRRALAEHAGESA